MANTRLRRMWVSQVNQMLVSLTNTDCMITCTFVWRLPRLRSQQSNYLRTGLVCSLTYTCPHGRIDERFILIELS